MCCEAVDGGWRMAGMRDFGLYNVLYAEKNTFSGSGGTDAECLFVYYRHF
jgi:hypothetical protein